MAGAGFEIRFESQRGALRVEGEVGFEAPRAERCCGWIAASVMVDEALPEVLGESGVAGRGIDCTDYAVDVVHVPRNGENGGILSRIRGFQKKIALRR